MGWCGLETPILMHLACYAGAKGRASSENGEMDKGRTAHSGSAESEVAVFCIRALTAGWNAQAEESAIVSNCRGVTRSCHPVLCSFTPESARCSDLTRALYLCWDTTRSTSCASGETRTRHSSRAWQTRA
jgi:hypothetical protein